MAPPWRRTILRISQLQPCSSEAYSDFVPSQSGDFMQMASGFRLN
jgi:hypothetical protein